MASDRVDLEKRIAAATDQDTVRGLIFNAIFAVARAHGDPDLPRRCDPAGKGDRVDFFSYPVSDFLRICWDVADALAPKLPFDEVLWKIGHRAGGGVLSSMLGRTLTAIAGTDGRALIGQTPHAYRATVSYGERIVSWPGERHAQVVFRRDFLVPPFHCGVFTGALEAIRARSVAVTGEQTGFLEARYELRWE